jgi:hypothetical protein
MFDDFMTEAARRALARAAVLAVACGASSREPLHLLWAVALDDSEAAEALRCDGVTREQLERICPLPLSADALGGDGALRIDAAGGRSKYPDRADFRRVVAAAAQAAASRGWQSEVGTGDLLAALGSVESAASRALAQLNVRSQPVSGSQSDALPAAIDVDFQIDWRETSATDQTSTLRILDAAANRAREGRSPLCLPKRSCDHAIRGPTSAPRSARLQKPCDKARRRSRGPDSSGPKKPCARSRNSERSFRPSRPRGSSVSATSFTRWRRVSH